MNRSLYAKLRDPHTPHQLLARRLVLLTAATLVVDLVLAFFFLLLEKGAHGTEIHDYGDAIFWMSSQLSSVSSSLRNPLTTGGRIMAIAVDLVAVGVVTLLVATIVQHFHLVNPGRADYFRKKKEEREKEAAAPPE